MIFDHLSQAHRYFNLAPNLRKALEYLQRTNLSAAAIGREDVAGDDVFALIQEYQPKPVAEGRFESHRVYWDVQYVVEGVEKIGVGQLDRMTETQPYIPEKDIAFYDGSGDFLTVRAGYFVILTQQDAHMPMISAGVPGLVRKVVMKCRIEG
jgi:YhcH/YjgK/YiaL family protein